ncbi:uncharacterized protein NEMAJ01_1601 [Nematocida major]|uniref:uncharacterized protein n=1 Tax=Nematocida major TaxID=1912982 RepID=UPI00200858C9|nr:uncharacterized protein NEMAJ01_1601 [Nematocida major]KAH9386705.1 hypothetical protein NEMAJ01_1601 [Nematocida major]
MCFSLRKKIMMQSLLLDALSEFHKQGDAEGKCLEKIQEILAQADEKSARTSLKECTVFLSKVLYSVAGTWEDSACPQKSLLSGALAYNALLALQEIMCDPLALKSIFGQSDRGRYARLLEAFEAKFARWRDLYLCNLDICRNTACMNRHSVLMNKLSIVRINKATIFNKEYWQDILALLEEKFKACDGFGSIEECAFEDFERILAGGQTSIQLLNELAGYCHMVCTGEITRGSLNSRHYRKNISRVRFLVQNWENISFVEDNVEFLQRLSAIDLAEEFACFVQAGLVQGAPDFCRWTREYIEALRKLHAEIFGQNCAAHGEPGCTPESISNLKKCVFIQELLDASCKMLEIVQAERKTQMYRAVQRDTAAAISSMLLFIGVQCAFWSASSGKALNSTPRRSDAQERLLWAFFILCLVSLCASFLLNVYYLKKWVFQKKRVYFFLLTGILLAYLGAFSLGYCILCVPGPVSVVFSLVDFAVLGAHLLLSVSHVYSVYRLKKRVAACVLGGFALSLSILCVSWCTIQLGYLRTGVLV